MLSLALVVVLLWTKLGWAWGLGYLSCIIVDSIVLFLIQTIAKIKG